MIQIIAYKCEETGQIFEDKAEYQRHYNRLQYRKKKAQEKQQQMAVADARWAAAYETEMSISEWPDFVIQNQEHFWREAARRRVSSTPGRVLDIEILEFTKFDVAWSERVSNTHSSPHNGEENWFRDPKKPIGYPGWTGRVEWVSRRHKNCPVSNSDLFDSGGVSRCRAYSGTGGGGTAGNQYKKYARDNYMLSHSGYDFRIYADDWPGMHRYHREQQLFNTLRGVKVP
jgi:hypothetical protein